MNDNKAFDENLDENVYQDIALDLIAVFKGKMPNDETIAKSAIGSEVDVNLLADAVRREFDNLQQIKNALDDNKESEPQSITRDQVAFEEIHRFLYDLMSNAIEMSVGYLKSLPHIEKSLTLHEFITIEAFYKWVEAGGKECPECKGTTRIQNPDSKDYEGGGETASIKAFDNVEYMKWQKTLLIDCPNCTDGKIREREFGSDNYNERYKEWLATLEAGNEFKTNAS